MTHILVDTSALIKWFHSDGESELAQARAIRDAHTRGDVDAHIIDLALYEVGNVLTRALRWPPDAVSNQLDDLAEILGPPLAMATDWLHLAASLAHSHTLSFYDACWAAAARRLGIVLISCDRKLITAGLAESPTSAVARLGLRLVPDNDGG